MERRPCLRTAPALSLMRNWPHSAGISQRRKQKQKQTGTGSVTYRISKITCEWRRDLEPAFLFFFFPVSWYTIRQVHSSTEFPELTVCLVPGTGGIEWSPPNQVFWLVIRQKKNPASKCYKNKAARLLPFQRVGLSEKREWCWPASTCVQLKPGRSASWRLPESAGRYEMIWVRKHESNTWFLVSNYAFIWYWLFKALTVAIAWPQASQGGSAAVRHWTPKCRLPTLQPFSGLCYKRSWWRPSDYSSSSAQWLYRSHCACVQAPSQPPFLGSSQSWVQGIAWWRFPWHVFVGSSYP